MPQEEIQNMLAASRSVILKNSAGDAIVPMTTMSSVQGLEQALENITGDVHLMSYEGAVHNTEELNGKIKKSGYVYIATSNFEFTQDSKTFEVERGDMLVCDGTRYTVIQGNISTSTTALIHNGETDNNSYVSAVMLGTRNENGVITLKSIANGSQGQVLTIGNHISGSPVWSSIPYPVKGVEDGGLAINHTTGMLSLNLGDGLVIQSNKLCSDIQFVYTDDEAD